MEQQLRKAALELIELRNENATIKDQLAAHQLASGGVPPPTADAGRAARAASNGARGAAVGKKQRGAGGRGGGGGKMALYGGKAEGASHGGGNPTAEPPLAQQPAQRLSLSTTGELLLGHAWAPPPPATSHGARPTDGRTVARLMPTSSTFEELDQLSSLLRKRAELSVSRPSTATAARPR